MKKLLIGILQHNKFSVTERCIRDIHQNTLNTEYLIFVIDNGSTDGSDQKLKDTFQEDNISIDLQAKNHGVIGGRNLIFDYFQNHTEFSHLLFIDNDQFVQPGWVDGYKEVFSKFPECVAGIEAWLMSSMLTPARKAVAKDPGFTYVGCGGMMISRGVFDILGSFDSEFNPAYFEDPDYCLRASAANFPVVWNTQSKIKHLAHQTLGQNAIKSGQSFRKSYKHFRSKWFNSVRGGPIMVNKV
jgi:GT2 family glycosyltransferase